MEDITRAKSRARSNSARVLVFDEPEKTDRHQRPAKCVPSTSSCLGAPSSVTSKQHQQQAGRDYYYYFIRHRSRYHIIIIVKSFF